MTLKPGLFMAVSMAKANKVEVRIEKARSLLSNGETVDVFVQLLNGKGKKIAKTKVVKKSGDPAFDESFMIPDHSGQIKFQILSPKSSAVLYQLEVEVLNLGTFAVPKWYILNSPDAVAEKEHSLLDPKAKVKGLTKVFGGNRSTLDREHSSGGSSIQQTSAATPAPSSLISGPVIGDMDADLAEQYEPYVLIHLWDRPKVIHDHAAKVTGSAGILDSFVGKLAKIEETYAKSLADLSTQFFKDHGKFKEAQLMKACYMGLVLQLKHRADEAKNVADGLKELYKKRDTILGADAILNEPVRKLKEDLTFLAKPLQKEEENLKRAQKLYDDFVMIMEKTNGVKIDQEDENWRQMLGLEDRTKLKAFEENLRSASIAEAMVRGVYNEGVTREYAQFQQAELERAGIVSGTLLEIGNLTNKFTQAVYKKNLAVQQKYRAYSSIEDLEKWTSAAKGDLRCPWGPQEDKEEAAIAKEEINPFSRAKRQVTHKQNANLTEEERKAAQLRLEREATKKAKQRKEQMSRALNTHSQAAESSAYLTPREKKSIDDSKQKQIEAEIEAEKERQAEEKKKKEEEKKKKEEEEAEEGKKTKRKSSHSGSSTSEDAEKKKRKEAKERKRKEKEKKLEEEKAKLEEDRMKLELEKEELEKAKAKAAEKEVDEVGEIDVEVVDGEINDGPEYVGEDYAVNIKDTPVVIDNGHAYIKAGFSGEMNPSLVIPSVLGEFPSLRGRVDDTYKEHPQFLFGNEALHAAMGITEEKFRCNTNVFSDSPEDWGDLLSTWGYMMHKLGADPTHNPMLFTIPTLAPTALKKKIYEVTFEQFGSPQSFVTPAPLLAPYAYGSCTGLVVDIGASSAQVVPVIDGYLIDHAQTRARHLGGKHDTNVVVQYLKEHQDKDLLFAAPSDAHLHNIARAMKDRMTFVPQSKQHFYDEIQILDTVEGIGDEEDDIPRASSGYVNGYALHRLVVSAGEKCFQPKVVLDDRDESIATLSELVTNSVAKCANDDRINLLSNIHLSGGVVTMPGFRDRFQKEIRELLNPKARKHVHVHGDHEARFAVWRGGSVLTSLDAFKYTWITSIQWDEDGPDRVCADRPVVQAANES